MQGRTILLIVTLTAVTALLQHESEAVSISKKLGGRLQPEQDGEAYPYLDNHLENNLEYDDEFSGRALMKRKRNAYPFGNSMKRMRKLKRSADQLEEYVEEQQRQLPRPGCCQCGDHYCCNSMCHGK